LPVKYVDPNQNRSSRKLSRHSDVLLAAREKGAVGRRSPATKPADWGDPHGFTQHAIIHAVIELCGNPGVCTTDARNPPKSGYPKSAL
jgi:hypothetical protein